MIRTGILRCRSQLGKGRFEYMRSRRGSCPAAFDRASISRNGILVENSAARDEGSVRC